MARPSSRRSPIRLDPKYASPYNGRGNVYQDKKDYDRTIADYNEAIRIDPSYNAALNNRAIAYENKEQYAQAIEGFDQLIRLQPTNANWWNYRCWDRALIDQL